MISCLSKTETNTLHNITWRAYTATVDIKTFRQASLKTYLTDFFLIFTEDAHEGDENAYILRKVISNRLEIISKHR